ncbi:unnamed protein product, partial [Brassicogethes aeneus]
AIHFLVVSWLTLFCAFLNGQKQQTSPCPKLFQYEAKNPNELDKWFGKITLTTDTDLIGAVWLLIIFDKPVLQLGTKFGQKILRLKPTEFLVQNLGYTLYADTPVPVRFFVKYTRGEVPPKLTEFRINSRIACPEAPSHRPPSSGIVLENVNSIFSNKTNKKKPEGGNIQAMSSIYIDRPVLELPDIPCGKVAETPIGLIAFGENTIPGQWPWHVAIYNFIEAQMRYTCGGSLISKKHVLTAAHCLTKARTTNPVKIDILTVYLGKHNLNNFGQEVQERKVSKITLHPQFSYNVLYNDIAILTLSEPVKFTDFVRPVCIWDDYIALDIVFDRLGTVVGWGFDENQQISNTLKKVEMPVKTHTDCILSNNEFFSKVMTKNNYCAGFRNGSSACNGDSGGGMVFPKQGTSGADTIWHIRGLVSIGVALQGQYICDNKQYIVFTDVAKYLKWIKDVLNEK